MLKKSKVAEKLPSYLWLSLFLGVSSVVRIQCKRLRNSAWDFLGGLFLVQGFFWALFETLGILGAFDFCPHSIIPVT